MAVSLKSEFQRSVLESKEETSASGKLLLAYEVLQSRYKEEGITQHNQMFLRKLACQYRRGHDARRVLRMVTKTARTLMMNDLEIVGWSIYLDRLTPTTDLEADLLYSAVAAKFYFDDDIRVFQAFLEHSSPNFSRLYNEWFRSHSCLMRITPKELSLRFRQLSEDDFLLEPRQLPDYNSLVEKILQTNPLHAPPEQVCIIVPVRVVVPAVVLEPKRDSAGVAEMQMDDLKLERNASNGSNGEFQGWSLPGLERVESISNVWPEVGKQGKRESGQFARE
jgi:hypothetical protein